MRKYILFLITLFLSIYLIPLPATAAAFVYPPEDNVPGWQSPFPYQRNIYLDFSIDPKCVPNPNGIPGADYDGRADDILKASDFIDYSDPNCLAAGKNRD